MRTLSRALVPAGILILAGACATNSGFDSHLFDGGKATAYVEVQNNNWADMDVFVIRYGEAERLGMVTSMTTQRFRVPQGWVNQGERVAVRVEPIGSSDFFASQDVPLEPGSVLALTVQNRLPQSHMLIR